VPVTLGVLALRIRQLGRYFGPFIDMDGAARPGDAWRALLRIAGLPVNPSRDEEVQAIRGHVLRQVSLDVEIGSVVCFAGSSDSASVLLQILGGVVAPTSGSAELYIPFTALLASGDGLDDRASAHENIRGSKGYREAAPTEAEAYATQVIEFADLHGFEHMTLRTFSTGMRLRLSAALALCGRPAMVLIDDVLAVGDIAFQQKCVDRVRELAEAGSTLLLNFSDEALVRQVATRVITLREGSVVEDAPVRDWMAKRYQSRSAEVEWQVLAQELPQDDVMALRAVSLDGAQEGDKSHVDVALWLDPKVTGVRCRPFVFLASKKTVVFRSLYPSFVTVTGRAPLGFTVRIPTDSLTNGEYRLGVGVMHVRGAKANSLKVSGAAALTLKRAHEDDHVARRSSLPLLAMALSWVVEPATTNAPS
jgi:ABC-type polysaccharide/polyol phosphate transport system ATPase subunit